MTSSVYRSLILLFETDPLARRLDQLRRSVREEYGGGSALTLPVHMTLFKWRSALLDPSLSDFLSEVPTEVPVQLGRLTLSIRHHAIWFAANSKGLPDLLRRTKAMLNACSISNLHTPTYPHMTVAYRDYPPETLKRIYQRILSADIPLHAFLQCSGLALAATDMNGIWHLQKRV
jgi:hypothetical protein